MFELKLKRITITFEFSFFAIMTLMLLLGNDIYVKIAFIVCLWHEAGHLSVMTLKHIKVERICFYGAGVKIQPDKTFDFASADTRVMVYLAGSTFNFITFILLKNSENDVLRIFAAVNAAIGAFNLLPLKFLDGGKIILVLIQNICSYQRAILLERFFKWSNLILIMIVLIIMTFVGKGNITLYATLCCLLFTELSY